MSGHLKQFLFATFAIGLIAIAWLNRDSFHILKQPGQVDLLQYWAAAKLVAQGENPYDPQKIMAVEMSEPTMRSILNEPIIMWNPPTAIPLIYLMGELDFPEARIVWLLLTILAFALAVLLGIKSSGARLSLVLVLPIITFFPLVSTIQFGQISWIILTGFSIGLYMLKKHRPFLSGLALALTLIKPHLLLLAYVSLFFSCGEKERIKFISGFLIGAVILGFSAHLLLPGVWELWLESFSNPPADFRTATIASFLRDLTGINNPFILFAPLFFGLLWICYLALKKSALIREPETIAALSLALAPYGWIYDQSCLIPLVILLALHSRSSYLTLLIINSFGLLPLLEAQHQYWWYPILMFILGLRRHRATKN